MNDFMSNLNDPKYKFVLYILGMVFIFVIALLMPSNSSNNLVLNEVSNKDSGNDDVLGFLLDRDSYNYDFKYTLTIDDSITIYEGNKNDMVYTFSINSGDNTDSYIDNNGLLYIMSDEGYILTTDNIYKDNYMYLFTSKYINNYIESGYLKDDTYLINLKDILVGYNEDSYITMNLSVSDDDYIINIDYTNLLKYIGNEVDKVILELEYSDIEK